ncbi:MAG TPA: hypothetical protein VF728_06835 [Nocardioides sp.]
MLTLSLPTSSLDLLVASALRLTDEGPAPEDVKAGWTAFVVFLLLILAVVVLAFSLVKQLRKAQAAKDAGVYGDQPGDPDGDPTGRPADDARRDDTA